MKVLITGANGQLGIELHKQLIQNKLHEVIVTSHSELDITKLDEVKEQLSIHQPEIVINCAAYTAVDDCEEQMEKAYRINAIGPKNLAIVCEELDIKLMHISTDYVFDGENPLPRREDDETRPRSIYGASKLLGEQYVQTFCKKFFIIRTAWLYGEGRNFVRTMLKLATTCEELRVVGDQIGSPTSTKELAGVMIELMQTEYYGIFHGTCEGQCSWYEFACKIFELKRMAVKVHQVTSEEFIQKAKRPQYSVLDNFMLKLYGMNYFSPWEEALKVYLEGEEVT